MNRFFLNEGRARKSALILPLVYATLFCLRAVGQAPKDMVYEPAVPALSNDYTLGPDSKIQPNVPQGKTISFQMQNSRIFPGTTRKISVYIPTQYKPNSPACLYVGLDGLGFGAPVVFDNLIAQHAMPVTIAVGIGFGEVSSANAPENPRFDRSLEFDTRSDRLARFILEEVLPAVEREKTPSGDPIVISADPNDHAIGGASTGGIGSFTVAWQRPDAFRRVFLAIGTFVGMRGGEQYYVQVRKTEPKPLRIFEQDGVHDEWGGGGEIGDWWMSNLTMNRALEFAGYDVKHVWGTGDHNDRHASALFPDAMRWLWRDYPRPIAAKMPGNPRLREIAQPGESWQLAAIRCASSVSIAVDPKGQVFYSGGAEHPVGVEDKSAPCAALEANGQAVAFDHEGRRYTALPSGGIAISSSGGGQIVAKGLAVRDFVVRNNGAIYATTLPSANSINAGTELWLIRSSGETIKQDGDIKGGSGVAFSPDGLWLFVSQSSSHQGLSYRVLPDGNVDAREPLYEFYVPDTADDSGAGGVAMDTNGWAYAATRMGIQVFDRNGRVTIILPLPGNEAATGVAFGGPNFDTLYVAAAGGKVYKRKLKVSGVPGFSPAVKLPKGSAG